jgi:uncharacterized protein involved in exopolysaccharide biosynthesis
MEAGQRTAREGKGRLPFQFQPLPWSVWLAGLFFFCLFGVLGGAAFLSFFPVEYEASLWLRYSPGHPSPLGPTERLEALTAELQSSTFIQQVAARLGRAEEKLDAAALASRIRLAPSFRSGAIEVRTKAASCKAARALLQAYSEAAVRLWAETQTAEAVAPLEALSKELEKSERKLTEALGAFQAYRASLGGQDPHHRLEELGSQVRQLQADLARNTDSLSLLQKEWQECQAAGTRRNSLLKIPAISESPDVAAALKKLRALTDKLASLRQRKADKKRGLLFLLFPFMGQGPSNEARKILQERHALEQELAEALRKAKEACRKRLLEAETRQKELQERLARIQEEVRLASQHTVDWERLWQAALRAQALHQALLEKVKSVGQSSGSRGNELSVLWPIHCRPTLPSPWGLLLVGLLSGTLGAFCLTAPIAWWQSPFRDPGELSRKLKGLPVRPVLVLESELFRGLVEKQWPGQELRAFLETALLPWESDGRQKNPPSEPASAGIVGLRPKSGATFCATLLALYWASQGRSTLLVDAHFTKPDLTRLFLGKTAGPSLEDYLGSSTLLLTVRKSTAIPHLFFLGCSGKGQQALPQEAVQSGLQTLLVEALSLHDRVVLDLGSLEDPPPYPWELLSREIFLFLVLDARRHCRRLLVRAERSWRSKLFSPQAVLLNFWISKQAARGHRREGRDPSLGSPL